MDSAECLWYWDTRTDGQPRLKCFIGGEVTDAIGHGDIPWILGHMGMPVGDAANDTE